MANFQPDGWVLDTYATIVLANGDIVSGGWPVSSTRAAMAPAGGTVGVPA